MDFTGNGQSRKFVALIMDARERLHRASVALRTGDRRTARRHILSALAWMAEAETLPLAERRKGILGATLDSLGETYDRLPLKDQIVILMKVYLMKGLVRLSGARAALSLIHAWQEVQDGRKVDDPAAARGSGRAHHQVKRTTRQEER